MKKTKRIVALLLAAVLAVGCLGYAADGADLPTVVFDAQTKEFRFENCGPNGTDLFRDFKNAMPGDNLVQHIRVKVENAGLDTVKIMLRSGESNADYATLLGMKVQSDGSWVRDDSIEHPATLTAVIPQLSGETITVTEWFKDKIKGVLNLKDQTIDPYLYSGTLAEGVYLGAYSESSQQDITVTLAIPKSAGNELQGLTATVDWIFTAEVIPYNPPTPDIPDEPTPSLDTVNHYAYIIGRNMGVMRYSDDGEPSGTAGRPILDIILGMEIHNVCVVVSRYFGGTLLGTGGLVRAYGQAAKEGLAASTVIEKIPGREITLTCDYNSIGKIQYIAGNLGLPAVSSDYTDKVVLRYMVNSDQVDSVIAKITEATAGKTAIETGDEVYYAIIDKELMVF